MPKINRPAIPSPNQSAGSLQTTTNALKEAVEIMQGQRGIDMMMAAVRWQDLVNLGLITAAQVPSKNNPDGVKVGIVGSTGGVGSPQVLGLLLALPLS